MQEKTTFVKCIVLSIVIASISLQSFAGGKEKPKKISINDAPPSRPPPALMPQEPENLSPTEIAFEAVATNPAATLVKVDGSAITQADMDKEIDTVKKMFEKQMGYSGGQPSPFATLLPKMKPQILDSLITKKLIDNACEKQKITISDKEVKKEIEIIKTILPKNMKLEDVMKKQDISQEDFEKEISQQLKIEKLVGVQEPSEKEIADFYEKADTAFSHSETIHARHILIKTEPTDSEAKKKEKRQKAENIQKKLKKGADFAELAKENSDCPSKVNGGDLNEFGRGEMVKSFEDVAFALKDKEISDVVETEYGYHIIQTISHTPAYKETLDEAKGKIVMRLKMAQLREKMSPYVEKLRKEANIEYVSIPKPEPPQMPQINEDEEAPSKAPSPAEKTLPKSDDNKKVDKETMDL
jgi:peptidyl-prolyl cis-trans isomerase C